MKEKKFNFVPESQLNKGSDSLGFTVNINKNSSIFIGKDLVSMYELEGKVVRVYTDVEKKSIAWIEIKGGNLATLKDVKVLKKISSTVPSILIAVSKSLKAIGVTKEMLPFKNVPVTIYKDSLVENPFHVINLSSYIKGK